MKITQETNEFKPITIVLETHDEVIELYNSIGNHESYKSISELEAQLKKVVYNES